MSEDERLELIEGADEDGNRLQLTVEKYFFYNGDEYVLLKAYEEPEEEQTGPETAQTHAENRTSASDTDTLYIMKVSVFTGEDGEEFEEFEPVDEDLARRLIPVIRNRFQMPQLSREQSRKHP
jgi:hypothetical protein